MNPSDENYRTQLSFFKYFEGGQYQQFSFKEPNFFKLWTFFFLFRFQSLFLFIINPLAECTFLLATTQTVLFTRRYQITNTDINCHVSCCKLHIQLSLCFMDHWHGRSCASAHVFTCNHREKKEGWLNPQVPLKKPIRQVSRFTSPKWHFTCHKRAGYLYCRALYSEPKPEFSSLNDAP